MAFIAELTPETDVWKQFPNLKLIKEFKDLKEKLGDELSSNLIKAIFLIWDEKGGLRNSGLTESQLISDISETILQDKDFDWEEYSDFKKFFLDKNLSKLEAMSLRYEQEIEAFNTMLETWPWRQKDADRKAKAFKDYKILLEDYIEIRDKIKQEGDVVVEYEGGYEKSLLESFGDQQ